MKNFLLQTEQDNTLWATKLLVNRFNWKKNKITNKYLLACLRDLKRAIRVDSEYKEKTVLNTIAEFNIIESDIVPLMLSFEGQSTEIANRFILACGKKKKRKENIELCTQYLYKLSYSCL